MSNETVTAQHIESIVNHIGKDAHHLVPLLHAIQEQYHYLPEASLKYLSELTGQSLSSIIGVATFYHQFRLKPAGKHMIKLCVGTACHVKGASQLVTDFKDYLKIVDHEDTDPDRLFTVTEVACLGCCMLAPAVQIDTITYGHVTKQTLPALLADFLKSQIPSTNLSSLTINPLQPHGLVKCCLCSSCSAAGANQIYNQLINQIKTMNLSIKIKVVGCTGQSYQAPLLEIETPDRSSFQYGLVKEDDVPLILANHFQPNSLFGQIKNKTYTLLNSIIADQPFSPITRYVTQVRDHLPDQFLTSQVQIATAYSGQLDPLNLDDYINHQGFEALKACLQLDDPKSIIDTIKNSGLRGRGGAGFPTATKWSAVSRSNDEPKVIICNGDEGDPGAFMDRMLLESFPYRLLEGMAIAALACGIKQGYIFLRAEYPLAIDRMKQAIANCQDKNLLGSLKVELLVSAGAFICGEETAMIAAIQGKRGQPHHRPPYPSEQGLWNKPTLINNVETFTLVPAIMLDHAPKFNSIGTNNNSGTKTFALAGKIKQGGLIEVAMGTTLRKIIYHIGGGLIDDKPLKAVQIGGPAGGCLPATLIDTPVDYESLKDSGTIMGSGGLIILDEDDCMVDMASYFMKFTQNESCGKCTFCRIGTKRMLEILEKLTSGLGQPYHLEQLDRLALQIKTNSLCGLGKAAPNPILSSLRYFKEEFIDHTHGKCPAKKCIPLIKYRVSMKCIGCTKCSQNCPVDAIKPRPYEQQEIDQEKCTKCDICFQVCPEKAIKKEDNL